MVAKVKLTYSVTLKVKGKNLDEIQDWLNSTTPMEIAEPDKRDYDESYDEEIIKILNDKTDADYEIGI